MDKIHNPAPNVDPVAGTSPTRTEPAGTVPAGPSGAGRGATGPATGELAPCDSPVALITFVGGPHNGYRIEAHPTATALHLEGGTYVIDQAARLAHWHVGCLADQDHTRPAAELDHVRPAEVEADLRPIRRTSTRKRPRS